MCSVEPAAPHPNLGASASAEGAQFNVPPSLARGKKQ